MIRILQPGDEARLEQYLLPQIESSMFLVGNMRAVGLKDNGNRFEGTYAAAFEGERIIGVVAHSWRGGLILQAPLELLDSLWQTAVAASQRPIEGVIGPNEQAQAVLNALKITPQTTKMDEPEKLYRLHLADLKVPPQFQHGQWRGRQAEASDSDLMTRWRVGYALEALGDTDSAQLWQQIRTNLQKTIAEGTIWILEENGRPVSSTGFNTTTAEAVQVGGVWTPPELRSRGYGRGAVAASLLAVREQGVETAVLFTGEENIPAQKAYEALGFRHIGDYRITLLKEPLSPQI